MRRCCNSILVCAVGSRSLFTSHFKQEKQKQNKTKTCEFPGNRMENKFKLNESLNIVLLLSVSTVYFMNTTKSAATRSWLPSPSLLRFAVLQDLQLLFLCASKPAHSCTFSSFHQGRVTTEMIKTFRKLIHSRM